MIVVNEYEYIENIIRDSVIPNNISIQKLMFLLAKYFYKEEINNAREYVELIFNKLKQFDLPSTFQKYKYENYLSNLCAKLLSGEINHNLRKNISINFYESEFNKINSCETDKQKKLLFTLYGLAKINEHSNGWINYKLKDIFMLANITATVKERALLIYELYRNGYITQTRKNDMLSYKVELGDNNEDVVMIIDCFENLGNQYIVKHKDGWKMCKICGKLFKARGKNSKYCKSCSKDRELNFKKQRNKKYYETLRN